MILMYCHLAENPGIRNITGAFARWDSSFSIHIGEKNHYILALDTYVYLLYGRPNACFTSRGSLCYVGASCDE